MYIVLSCLAIAIQNLFYYYKKLSLKVFASKDQLEFVNSVNKQIQVNVYDKYRKLLQSNKKINKLIIFW